MSANDKTYTEVLLEVYEKMDTVEQRIVGKVDAIIRDNADFKAELAAGDAKFKAHDKRIDDNSDDIKTNVVNITKARNLNATLTAFMSGLAAFIGWNR